VYDRAKAAALRFNVPHAFQDYEDLLASGQVDAVTIASPIGLHYEQGKLAIEHGLHVHFNKSMTTTVDEADDLIERAKRKGVKLVSCPGQMLRPQFQRIRELIHEGALGRLTWAVTGSAFGNYHENEKVRQGDDPLSNINPAWYYRRPGGGPLYDMTVYGLHAMTGILGPAKRVTAMSGVRVHEREFKGETLTTDMDDNTFMVLDFGDNLFAFVYGAAAGGLADTWHPQIFGTKGVIKGGKLNNEVIDYPGRELEEKHKDVNASLPHVVGAHRQQEEAHVYEDIMQLVDWIRDDKPTLASAEHARHVIEIFDAAYKSAETGQAQVLRTKF
ncbi:MAG: Gfo/Idh/MocA family oxidoreductase, partial [Chloroflexota bacterium]|nr:Gfo/Idh/MocA family oxidoreductase [Chloroflexota bacterium]